MHRLQMQRPLLFYGACGCAETASGASGLPRLLLDCEVAGGCYASGQLVVNDSIPAVPGLARINVD